MVHGLHRELLNCLKEPMTNVVLSEETGSKQGNLDNLCSIPVQPKIESTDVNGFPLTPILH